MSSIQGHRNTTGLISAEINLAPTTRNYDHSGMARDALTVEVCSNGFIVRHGSAVYVARTLDEVTEVMATALCAQRLGVSSNG